MTSVDHQAGLTVLSALQTAGIQQFHAQAQVAKQVAKQVYVQQQLEYGRFGALLEFATVRPAVESTYKEIKLQGWLKSDAVYSLFTLLLTWQLC